MGGGGGQQSQGYNMSGLNSAGNGYATSGYQPMQSFQPNFMSQPNYGYQNPYANIYSALSQQQAMQPQAPIQSQPAAFNQTQLDQTAGINQPATQAPAFDQSANNLAAGLPAQGQAIPASPGIAALQAPTAQSGQTPANTGSTYTATALGIKQGADDPNSRSRGEDINMMAAEMGVTPADLVARGWYTQS